MQARSVVQPTYDDYDHVISGCTPEHLPVLNGIARDFGVFDRPRSFTR